MVLRNLKFMISEKTVQYQIVSNKDWAENYLSCPHIKNSIHTLQRDSESRCLLAPDTLVTTLTVSSFRKLNGNK